MRHMVVGAASDLVFVSTYLECDHFTVHQGDSCCVTSPACCVAQRQPKGVPLQVVKATPEVYSKESNLGCQSSVAPTLAWLPGLKM